MRKIIALTAGILLLSNIAFSQLTYKIKADTLLVANDTCNAELILKNATKNVNGFLYNKGDGRTEFRKVMTKIDAGNYIYEGDTLKFRQSTQRINPRVQTIVSSVAVTPHADSNDAVIVTAQASALTITAPSGTPVQAQPLMIRIKDNGTARGINWNGIYNPIGVTLPLSTVPSKKMYIHCIYDATESKWDVISVKQEPSPPAYMTVSAAGATVTFDGNYRIYTFGGNGTLTVTELGADPTYGSSVEYLIVGGGGAGGGYAGGGGGAGGVRAGNYTVTASNYFIVVGNGGAVNPNGHTGGNGANSSAFGLSAAGGGGGGWETFPGNSGGSGGGAGFKDGAASSGNTPSTSPSQGNNGERGDWNTYYRAGGGGGAGAPGSRGSVSGNGGIGIQSSITGTATYYAGGGGGSRYTSSIAGGSYVPGVGGNGGGGNGEWEGETTNIGSAGAANTGGGGGGGGAHNTAAVFGYAGGSGVVIIRVRFQ